MTTPKIMILAVLLGTVVLFYGATGAMIWWRWRLFWSVWFWGWFRPTGPLSDLAAPP